MSLYVGRFPVTAFLVRISLCPGQGVQTSSVAYFQSFVIKNYDHNIKIIILVFVIKTMIIIVNHNLELNLRQRLSVQTDAPWEK